MTRAATWCSSGGGAVPRRAPIIPASSTVSAYPPASTTPASRSTGSSSGSALDRLLTGIEGPLDHLGDHRVLLLVAGLGREPPVLHVREIGGDAMCHLADDGENRALGRIADRAVCLIGGPRERGADQHRVDELARAARELLGGPADQLGEDHARVAARAQQRGAGHRGDDLVPADVVDRARLRGAGQAIELLQHRAQREHHVVAGVAVGDREHIEVVDLLAARLERRKAGLYDRAKTNDARVGHRSEAAILTARGRRDQPGYRALTTLPAFRQRVQTYTRRGVPPSSMRTRWRFGSNRRLVATIEWLRLWPNDGPFAHT